MSTQPFLPPNGSDDAPKYAHVRVTGKNAKVFAKVRGSLVKIIKDIAALPSPGDANQTVGDELKQLSGGLLDYAKSKLATPGAELAKIEAEIVSTFAEAKKRIAEAGKIKAETTAIHLDNQIKSLRIKLITAKIVVAMSHDGSEEAIFIAKQIEDLLIVVKSLEGDMVQSHAKQLEP